MIRGTTPTIIFDFCKCVALELADKILVTFKQGDKVLFDKEVDLAEQVKDDKVYLTLTQEETLLMGVGTFVQYQMRLLINGSAFSTPIYKDVVLETLDESVMGDDEKSTPPSISGEEDFDTENGKKVCPCVSTEQNVVCATVGDIGYIKGDDGVSPTITVKESSIGVYILTITDVNGTFDTPNLAAEEGLKDVIPKTDKGIPNGVATLDDTGRVPATQLPSYVDDVLEFDKRASFPEQGEDGKIYIAKDTNLQYRWSGSEYVEISSSLALGETPQTAYAGDKGKKNADDIAELKNNAEALEKKLDGIKGIYRFSESSVSSSFSGTTELYKEDLIGDGTPREGETVLFPDNKSNVMFVGTISHVNDETYTIDNIKYINDSLKASGEWVMGVTANFPEMYNYEGGTWLCLTRDVTTAPAKGKEWFCISEPAPVTSVNGSTGEVEITAESLSLATVATSGDYNDLSNTPDLSEVGKVKSVNGKTGDVEITSEDLGLANVATSGDYSDLSGTPSIPDVPAWALEEEKPAYTKEEVGLGLVDNVRQYSTENEPPYPVTSVNQKTGNVTITASELGASRPVYYKLNGEAMTDTGGIGKSYTLAKSNLTPLAPQPIVGDTVVFNTDTNIYIGTVTVAQTAAIAVEVKLQIGGGKIDVGVTTLNGRTGAVTITKSDVGLDLVENVKQYSASNPPPYPVISVNGESGEVVLTKESVGLSAVDNVLQYSEKNQPPYPVVSVNEKTGAVVISADDLSLSEVAKTGVYSDIIDTPQLGLLSSKDTITNADISLTANIEQSKIKGLETALASKANTEDLADIATSGSYLDLKNAPVFALVATSGKYTDLIDKPVIPNYTEATQVLSGLMSATDKKRLDDIYLLVGEETGDVDEFVNTIREVLKTFENFPEGSNIASLLSSKADKTALALKADKTDIKVTSVASRTGDIVLTKADVGLSLVDNVKQYSASNEPPYPVTSVQGRTGKVTITTEDLGLGAVATSNSYNDLDDLPDLSSFCKVESVNGKTGEVSITAKDLSLATVATSGAYSDLIGIPSIPYVYEWALSETKPTYSKSEVGLGSVDNVKQYSASNPPPYPVTSVNGKTGAVTIDTYTKPTGGIPATDLASAVQTSLGKADSALQSIRASGSNGVTASASGNKVTVSGVTATTDVVGVAKLHKAENCQTFTSDDGGATPAAVKKAVTQTFKASSTQYGSVKVYVDSDGYLCIDT